MPSSPTSAISPRGWRRWPAGCGCGLPREARLAGRQDRARGALAAWLAVGARSRRRGGAELAEKVDTAAALAKADLRQPGRAGVSRAAGHHGRPLRRRRRPAGDDGGRAIGEQYLPLSATAPVPGTSDRRPAGDRRQGRQHRRRLGRRREAERLARPVRAAPRGHGHRAHRAGVRLALLGARSCWTRRCWPHSGATAGPAPATPPPSSPRRRLRLGAPAGAAAGRGAALRVVQAALGARRADVPGWAARARSFAALRRRASSTTSWPPTTAAPAGRQGRGRPAATPAAVPRRAAPSAMPAERGRLHDALAAQRGPVRRAAGPSRDRAARIMAAAACGRPSTATSTLCSSWTKTPPCVRTGWLSW